MTDDERRVARTRRRAEQRETRRTQRWIKRTEISSKSQDPKLDRELESLREKLANVHAEMERRRGNHEPL